MALLTKNKASMTDDGIQFMYGTGDVTGEYPAGGDFTVANVVAGDQFGYSVAIGPRRFIVGAPGTNGGGTDEGAAYVFEFSTLVATLTEPTPVSNSAFGYSVSAGNNKFVVGAPTNVNMSPSAAGKAYIFNLGVTGANSTCTTLTAGNAGDKFGWSTAIGNGKVVVGAPQASTGGLAYVYELDGTLIGWLSGSASSGDGFGQSVAIGCGRIVVGAPGTLSNKGAIYVYDIPTGNQFQLWSASGATSVANDYYGYSVAIGSGRIVVGAPALASGTYGHAYIYDLNGNQIANLDSQNSTITSGLSGGFNFANDEFGRDVAIGNGRIHVSAPGYDTGASGTGAIFVFDLDGNYIDFIKEQDADDGTGHAYGWSMDARYGRLLAGVPGVAPYYNESAYSHNIVAFNDPFTIYDIKDMESFGD